MNYKEKLKYAGVVAASVVLPSDEIEILADKMGLDAIDISRKAASIESGGAITAAILTMVSGINPAGALIAIFDAGTRGTASRSLPYEKQVLGSPIANAVYKTFVKPVAKRLGSPYFEKREELVAQIKTGRTEAEMYKLLELEEMPRCSYAGQEFS